MSPRSSSPMTVEYTLLGLLDGRPMHGYDLHRAFTSLEGLGLIWSLKRSLLYALLDKLKAAGLISATELPGQTSPPRTQYQLTPAGRAAYLDWRQSPVPAAHAVRQDFLARLYFAGLAGAPTALLLLERQQETSRAWLENLQQEARRMDSAHPFEQFVFDFRIRQVQAVLDWLEACAGRLAG
jgi:PadR family transcriptional regulator AphA